MVHTLLALSFQFLLPWYPLEPAAGRIGPDKIAVDRSAGEKKSEVRATRFAAAPTIDGRLDEDGWHQAAELGDFYQTEPGDNVKPSHPTEVRIGYDAKFLCIGIHASDQPGQVRSTVARRDDGYTVEVAVSFTSLRFEAGAGKRWGVNVLRIVRHLDEWDMWMPLRRESRDFRTATFTQFLEQAGHITGIENVARERTLELIPTLAFLGTGHRSRASNPSSVSADRFVNQPLHVDPGLTAKLSLSSG